MSSAAVLETLNEQSQPAQQEEVKIAPYQNYIEVIQKVYPIEGCILTPTEIYLAKDNLNQRNVILKKIIKSKLNDEGKEQAIQEQQLQTEFSNDNLVKGYAHYETDDAYCIVMEVVNQADYFKLKLIENYKPIRKGARIQMYINDVLHGLKCLHDQDYAHLDIKLENLYCEKIVIEGVKIRKVKIGDFGITKKVDPVSKKIQLKSAIGTRDYMAPEIKGGASIDKSADIWAMGVTLYHMVTGYVPTRSLGFEYSQEDDLPYRKRDWRKISGGDELFAMLKRMIKWNPSERATVDELLQDPFMKIQEFD